MTAAATGATTGPVPVPESRKVAIVTGASFVTGETLHIDGGQAAGH